jgi:hypothetical protein
MIFHSSSLDYLIIAEEWILGIKIGTAGFPLTYGNMQGGE